MQLSRIRPILATLCTLALATGAAAQGIYIDRHPVHRPHPPARTSRLDLLEHQVDATVNDSLVEYRVTQRFRNPGRGTIEGTYLFPVPREAVATGLTLTINGKPVAGEVLEKGKARGIYQEIVRKTRDPALLEFIDQGLLRASIFPIGPGADVEVAIRFTARAERVGDLESLTLPLEFAAGTTARLAVHVRLESSNPLTTVYSPTHKVDIVREGAHAGQVSFEGRPEGRTNFILYFATRRNDVDLSLLTHRLPARDGTFALVIAADAGGTGQPREPRDVVFVLDRSGSMAGSKWDQAVAAVKYGLLTLDPGDRFALISFATDVRSYKETLVQAGAEEVEGALDHLARLQPAGGTHVSEALAHAMAQQAGGGQRMALVAFLTDGLPTIGETDSDRILSAVVAANQRRARLFTFGVGYDVNTLLLDRLGEENRGASDYIEEGENLEVRLSAFFAKVQRPALVAPRLEINGVETHDIHPAVLPDLFAGTSLVVTGRYSGTGPATVSLSGKSGGGTRTFSHEVEFPARRSDTEFLPALWASRKVGFLLNQIRLHGADRELVDAVIALGREHGIVTPYTSALVVEEGMRLGRLAGDVPALRRDARFAPGLESGAAEGKKAELSARRSLEELEVDADEEAYGKIAVQVARQLSSLAYAASAGEAREQARQMEIPVEVRHVAGRHFLRLGEVHLDTALDRTLAERASEIVAFSEAWFELLERHPELSEVLALGTDLVFVLDGRAVRIVAPGPR